MISSDPQNHIIQQIQCWLKSIIIELNLCPFAQREFINDRIRYQLCDATTLDFALLSLADECQYLDEHADTETTLLIFSDYFNHFDDFLELIEYADLLIDELNYRGTYQLAHFHPDYCFDGVAADDASNFTNRAPWPVLHILREDSLQKAIDSHPDINSIPDNNIKLARQLGSDKMQALLNKCK